MNLWSEPLTSPRRGILLTLFACTVLLSSAVGGPGRALADGGQATLLVLEGDVTVVSAAAGTAHVALSGETLWQGDRVRTGVPGGALITFFDGSELELDAGTDVELQVLQPGVAGGVVRVISQMAGVTVNRVQHLAGDSTYELQTPNTIALVRGTVFLGRVERDAASGEVREETLALEEGWVDVRSGDQEQRLYPGQRARVRRADGRLPPGQQRKLDVDEGTILTSKESGEQGGRLTEPGESASHAHSQRSQNQDDKATVQNHGSGARQRSDNRATDDKAKDRDDTH